MIWLAVLACRPPDLTVQALVDARAQQLALDAAMPTRLALACGGLAAQVAPISQAAWASLDSFEPQAELAEVVDLGPAEVQSHSGTGAVKLAWSAVEFSPGLVGRVDLDVLRATNQFVIGFAQNPGEPPGVKGSCAVAVQSDATGDPVLNIDLQLDIGAQDHQVVMPSRPDADAGISDSGSGLLPPRWPAGGALLPLEGDFQWQRVQDGNKQVVLGLDAAESGASVEAWPSVATAEDWEHKLSVDLRRETDAQ